MFRTKRIAVAAALALVCTSIAAFAAKPLRLGAVLPLTGDLQAQGVPSLTGVKLAAKQINQAGGIRGAHIKIFSGDTQKTLKLKFFAPSM